MYAVIETGGKQYKVQDGAVIRVEKLSVEVGKTVELDKVLMIRNEKDMKVGTPYVEGAKVVAKVLEQGKAKKILVFRYRPKEQIRKHYGHRQPYTTLQIEKIEG